MKTSLSPIGIPAITIAFFTAVAGAQGDQTPTKKASSLYPKSLVEQARHNIQQFPGGATALAKKKAAAEAWLKCSDEQLWELMFGHTITRSWMVWSDGYCPACKKDVRMYNWQMDAMARPWKLRCPHCQELFPKNDFERFYKSGLDEHHVFDPKRADRSLLFNVEHPSPNDPLHTFGVDDGEGYIEGDKRWRFIGAYLIYGQWKQAIVDGVVRLSELYLLTGEQIYAHKAGVLLDRIADLYPTFNFGMEGRVYEVQGARGYVSTWHDACEEVRKLALAYDQIFEGLADDTDLVRFLSSQAQKYKLDNPKACFTDIQRNIENRIFRDTLTNRQKIRSNQPRTEVAEVIMKTVLGWPGNRMEVNEAIDAIIEAGTTVDGMTGEKGLAGYATIGPRAIANLLGRFARIDETFLTELFLRQMQLYNTYRFHIDTACLGKYYPQIGDTGVFALKSDRYAGIDFSKKISLEPSGGTFLWNLYELTGDIAFLQTLYRLNGNSVEGLPWDLFAGNAEHIQRTVAHVIAEDGPDYKLDSVNKRQWHLAILRSGKGDDSMALWLDYDSGGRHSHRDGMNLGLFAKGLDLMPDFGYPPVQYGGWLSPRARWYTMTAAHNTIVVDGKSQKHAAGHCDLWVEGKDFAAMAASCPKMYDIQRYERSVSLVNVSGRDAYIVDVFRVAGGKDHAKFMHSHFASLSTPGLHLSPSQDFGHETQTRNYQTDPNPAPAWIADWAINDCRGYLPAGSKVHLRCTDLTAGASASTSEKWIAVGMYDGNKETWIPQIMVRRQSDQAPLVSTFASIIEPYGSQPVIASTRRLPLVTEKGEPCDDSQVAIEIVLANGRRDLIINADRDQASIQPQSALSERWPRLVQKDSRLTSDGALVLTRLDTTGKVARLALADGSLLAVGETRLQLHKTVDYIEIDLSGADARVVAGDAGVIKELTLNGRELTVRR